MRVCRNGIGPSLMPSRHPDLFGRFLTPQQEMSTLTLSDMLDFMESAPRDLMLIMRTTNLLRSINRDLGGTSFHRMAVRAWDFQVPWDADVG